MLEIEVEYQGATIGKYGLDFNGTTFLINHKTNRLFGKREMWHARTKTKEKPF